MTVAPVAPASDELRRALAPGEPVLWQGRPQQGLVFRKFDLVLIVGILLWTGEHARHIVRAAAAGNSAFDAPILAPVAFIFLGFLLLAGRFLVDRSDRARTLYAVTDRRAIIIRGFFERTVRTFNLRDLDEIEFTTEKGGRGTLTFGCDSRWLKPQFRGGEPGMDILGSSSAFNGIDDAARVLGIIRAAQSAANPWP